MKNKDNTKAELLKELEILEQRIIKLQKSNKQRKKSSQELKKDQLHLEQLAEKGTTASQESKDLLDKIVKLNPDWIFIKDKNYRHIMVNEGYASGVGKSVADLIGKNDIEIGFPEELIFGNPDKGITGFRNDDKRALKGETIHNEYDPATAADGTLHIFDTYKIPLRDKNGDIYAVLGYSRDITERKQAEEEIKSAAARWQTTFDAMNDAVSLIDYNGIVLQCNQSYLNLLGKTETEILGKHCWEIVHGANKPIDGCPIVKMKKSFQRESLLLPIDDKLFNVAVDPIFDANNNLIKAVHIMTDITELKQSGERLKKTFDAAIDTMSKIIEAKDPYTSDHQHRVCQLAVPLARELGLAPDKVEGVRIASLIHDIGKIGLPTEILSKPGKLTDIEFSLIKGHSQIGYDILKSIDFSYPIAQIVLQHHERLDGSGYPNKLNGDKIILEAKIIGIADVVEAMSSFRPYRPALGIDAALEEISKNKGILYDPEVVAACLKLFKEKGFEF